MSMPPGEAIIPLKNKKFGTWMGVSRVAQILLAFIIMGFDAAVIDEWNRNQLGLNALDSDAAIHTWVGGTPFTGIVMFTTVLTLSVIFYDLVAPTEATIFYHIYGEIVLESLLVIFWLISFAGMGSYITEIQLLTSFLNNNGPDDLWRNTRNSRNNCIVITVLSVVVFGFTLANMMGLIAFVVQTANRRPAAQTEAHNASIRAITQPQEDREKVVTQQEIPESFK
ncbi:MAG: hypothetical protein M1839_004201 [Geoglossum umbratile]|nr:MAG: hypothetical protein M1839_004201 [Geoglossum umbratile]